MIPQFKYYFYPVLHTLSTKGECSTSNIVKCLADSFELTVEDMQELTKGGTVTKHRSRVYYCVSYLKKMNLIESTPEGNYAITHRGIEVLEHFGPDLTLSDLRSLPEFMVTQINSTNDDFVYVKPHLRGGKMVGGYYCNRKSLKKDNPNIGLDVTQAYRDALKNVNK